MVQNKPTVTFGTQTGDLDEKTSENYDINYNEIDTVVFEPKGIKYNLYEQK